LKKYIGQHFKDFRDHFKDHEHFKNLRKDEYPSWYSSFLARFETACDRFQTKNAHEMPNGGSNEILPLHFETHPLQDLISTINVKQILKNIMQNADYELLDIEELGPFAKRAMIAITWSAVGSAGEIKCQGFNDWKFDPYLNVTDISWREIKTITKHAMPMVPDRQYLVCFYHAIGCYLGWKMVYSEVPTWKEARRMSFFRAFKT